MLDIECLTSNIESLFERFDLYFEKRLAVTTIFIVSTFSFVFNNLNFPAPTDLGDLSGNGSAGNVGGADRGIATIIYHQDLIKNKAIPHFALA